MIQTFSRGTRYAFQNFFRNFWLSLATLTIISIFLLLVNIIISINFIKTNVLGDLEKKIDILLPFKQGIPEAEVLKIRYELEQNDAVAKVTVVTPDDNLLKFRNSFPKLAEKALPALNFNPLGYTLLIQAQQLSDYEEILTSIEKNEQYLSKLDNPELRDYRSITSGAAALSEKANIGALVLAGIFFLIAIIILFNTIRVSIYTHREEIGVMKLVGATNWFVRMPFLLESLMYSFISILLMTGIMFSLINLLQPYLTRFFAEIAEVNLVQYYTDNFLLIFGSELLLIVLLNVLSTGFALRRYLKV